MYSVGIVVNHLASSNDVEVNRPPYIQPTCIIQTVYSVMHQELAFHCRAHVSLPEEVDPASLEFVWGEFDGAVVYKHPHLSP